MKPLLPLSAVLLLGAVPFLTAADKTKPSSSGPQRFDLTARASVIDPRAKEHPEIDFVFTDKNGKPADVEHACVDTRVKDSGKLVIWLMGHNQGLFEHVASYGHHAIQVHYANGWFGKFSKAADSDEKILGDIRLEACTGEDVTPEVTIPKPDGMMERSFQFVKWLAKENPQGNWDQFIAADGKGLNWEKVIITGISHGATTAARFGIYQKVDRVVMFSGARDNNQTWQSLPSATPPNRFFGFTHVLDGGWTGHHYCRSWEMMGLSKFGPIVNVDQNKPPYGNTRRLVTTADVGNKPDRAHGSVVPGGSAVKDSSGQYIHEAVWKYLFTEPVETTGQPVASDLDCLKNPKAPPHTIK